MKEKIIILFNIVFLGVFYYLSILAVGKMNLESPLSALIIVPVFYFVFHIYTRFKNRTINFQRLWYGMWFASVVLMLIVVFMTEVDLTWDWGRILISAHEYVVTGEVDYPEYFMRCPNNQYWLVFTINVFAVVRAIFPNADFEVYKIVSMLISCLFVQIMILFIYKTARLVWNEKRAFFAGILPIIYVPFYLYAQYMYTDTPGACIAVLMIYFSFKLFRESEKKKKILYAVVIGLLGALAFYVKIIVFILYVAIIITYFFRANIKSFLIVASILVLTFMGTFLLLDKGVDVKLGFNESEAKSYEFPPVHWVMMALNTSGGFNQDDVLYTRSYETYEEKKEADIIKIKERVADLGLAGTVKHIFYTKQLRTWADSCIAGDNYISRSPIREASIGQNLFSYNGKYHWISNIYTWIIHLILLLGMFASAVYSRKKKVAEQEMLVGRIAIFGLFLFLSVWECNARYLFTLMPIIILVASEGIFEMLDWGWSRKRGLQNEEV